eukprot:gene6956-11118_t
MFSKQKQSEIKIHSKESGFPIYKMTNEDNCIKFLSKKTLIPKELKDVPGAVFVQNVLSGEECDQFIKITESMGYGIAPITTGRGMIVNNDIRNNKRVIWQMEQKNKILETIFCRIKKYVPEEVKLMNSNIFEPIGLNERLRFYRYKGDEIFNQHYDGCFPRSSNEMSLLTFIVYLNDDFEKGETTFYDYNGKMSSKVKPVKGSCLMFYHGHHPWSPLHEGSKCENGTKYVLRSDVMFKKK